MPDKNSNDENIENEALAQEFADFVEDTSTDSVKVPETEAAASDLSMDMDVVEDTSASDECQSGIPIAGVAVPEGSDAMNLDMEEASVETPVFETVESESVQDSPVEESSVSSDIFENMEQEAESVASASVQEEAQSAEDGTVTVQPVQFASFEEKQNPETEANKNLDILMDIKLQLTVELGRTELPVKNVLELTRGSIVELQKVAGEPVELFANGKLVATGEVVVIEDNFGLRITSITDPKDRIKGL